MAEAKRDQNFVPTLLGVSSVDGITPVVLWADPTTHRLLTDAAAGLTNPMTTGGDLIYGGASGVPTRLANGTAGQFLTSQGTTLAPIWSSAGAGDMVLASVQTNSGAKTFLNNTLLLRNPGNTFSYTLTSAAIAADRVLNLPLITGTDTLATLGLAQTFTAVQTMTALNLIEFANTGLTIRNPANTFDYTIAGGAIVAARTLNLPVITVTDTIAVLGLAQTFTATQTFGTLVATTFNGNTFTVGTGVLTIAAAKTLTVSNTLTLAGTDGTTMTFPTTSKTLAANDGSNMTLASQAIGDLIIATSTTAIGRLADIAVGSVLVSGGVGTAPTYSANPQVTTIELGNATDTTIARVSAGLISVEGNNVMTVASTDTVAGVKTFNDGSLKLTGATSGASTLKAPAIASTYVHTLPAMTTTLASVGNSTEASNATPTVAITGIHHTHTITALAAAATFGAPTVATGALDDTCHLIIRIKDNATARALTWNAIFRASSDLALPSTTVLSKTLYVGFKYNVADTKWDLLAVLNNF